MMLFLVNHARKGLTQEGPLQKHVISYQNSSGKMFQQSMAPALTHFFNHQAHHRGQVHAGLTIVGMREPAPLDLLVLQRGG
jgi:uncharacterized damage-inducible protein DinB